jgi:hypothetical protein
MCEICRQTPCHYRCPNYEPKRSHIVYEEGQEIAAAQMTLFDLYPDSLGGCLCSAPCGCYDG